MMEEMKCSVPACQLKHLLWKLFSDNEIKNNNSTVYSLIHIIFADILGKYYYMCLTYFLSSRLHII